MNEKSRTSSENMAGVALDVASNIMAVQILQTWSAFPECTLKLSELKSLILDQLSSSPEMMRQITKCQSSCTADPENPGMLRFPSRTSLNMYKVPKWPRMTDVSVGPRQMENGWVDEPAEIPQRLFDPEAEQRMCNLFDIMLRKL